jgi:hypothetical protein
VEVSCLAIADDGLWTCSNEKSGFVLGLSKDEGATFETKLHFCDIRGPLACAPGSTTHNECTLGGNVSNATPPWPPQRAILGCGGETGTDGGFYPDGAPSDASINGPGPGGGGDDGSCSIRAPAPRPFAAAVAAILATLALVRRRTRARRP